MDNTQKVQTAIDSLIGQLDIYTQETDLVMLREKVEVSPLTGNEELLIKTKNVTLNTFIKNFNELLYSKCKFSKKSKVKSYETFLKYLTPHDKALLIYALSLSTFDNLGTIGHVCEHCEEKFPVDIKSEELWHDDSAPEIWDHSESPFEYIDRQSVLNSHLTFNLKIPNEADRLKLMDFLEGKIEQNMDERQNAFSLIETVSFLTSSIIISGSEKDPEDKVLEDLETEILPFLKNLPLKIKDAVLSELDLNVFDKYMPKLYQTSVCTRCHKLNNIPVNIETSFFRKSLLLLSEV